MQFLPAILHNHHPTQPMDVQRLLRCCCHHSRKRLLQLFTVQWLILMTNLLPLQLTNLVDYVNDLGFLSDHPIPYTISQRNVEHSQSHSLVQQHGSCLFLFIAAHSSSSVQTSNHSNVLLVHSATLQGLRTDKISIELKIFSQYRSAR